MMKFRILGLTSVLFVLLSSASFSQEISKDPAVIAKGQAIFGRCQQCHEVKRKSTGPALAGIDERRPVKWIIDWVHNSAKVIASGDEYAVKLFKDNQNTPMTAFTDLSDADILSVLAFIKAEAAKPDAVAATPAGGQPGTGE